MYSEFRIKNFRGLRSLSMDRLARVNLVVGANNAGKTSLLEALWLLQAPGNPLLVVNLAAFRGLRARTPQPGSPIPELHWDSLFYGLLPDNTIEITGLTASGRDETLKITLSKRIATPMLSLFSEGIVSGSADIFSRAGDASGVTPELLQYEYSESGHEPATSSVLSVGDKITEINAENIPKPSIFLSARRFSNAEEVAERFTQAQDAGGIDSVVRSLKALEPQLTALSLGYTRRQPTIRAHVGLASPLPLPLLGGGAVRLADMLFAVHSTENGLVLIDEVEAGLYYRNLESAWRSLAVAARGARSQIVATTHSLECVIAALDAFENGYRKDFLLHRMDRAEDGIRLTTYDYQTARAAVEMNLEVR